MNFAYHAVSILGNGHIRTERPCQDASGVWCDHRPCLIVCDGRAVPVTLIMEQGQQWKHSAVNVR